VADYRLAGNPPRARGNAANSRGPAAGSFATAEGTLSLGVNEPSQFDALARACGRPDWLQDARFATPDARRDHGQALVAELEAVLLERTAAQWERTLATAGVPVAIVATLPEALGRHAPDDGGLLGLPFRFDGQAFSPGDVTAGPRHGEHTEAILRELGRSDEEIRRLARDGVVLAVPR